MAVTQSHRPTEAQRIDAGMESLDGRGLGALIKEMRDEVMILFRQEVALARTEVSEKMSHAMRNIMVILGGALLAFAGLTVLLIAAGHGVTAALMAAGMEANALWLGPLIVGALVVIIGAMMAMSAKKKLQEESLVPEQTVQSLKENKEWVKSKTM